MPTDGSGSPERLTTKSNQRLLRRGPPMVKFWRSLNPQRINFDISVLRLEGEPQPFIQSPFEEQFPTFSPDGRWLAYASNQSGRMEVYVTPYPGPGPRHHISAEGGRAPAWAPNGGRLFYRTLADGEGLRFDDGRGHRD